MDKKVQNKLDTETFFMLANEVLKQEGRPIIPPAQDGPQRSIIEVLENDKVLQIIAGPGAGKTEMLTWRVLFELFALRTPANEIIVTTFTRRAATELQVRLVERSDAFLEKSRLTGIIIDDPHIHDVRIGTIHSLCDSILAEFCDDYMANGYQLIDDVEATVRLAREYRLHLGYVQGGHRLLNRLLDEEPLKALFRPPWESERWPASNMARVEFIKELISQHVETWEPRCSFFPRQNNGIENAHQIENLTEELITLENRWMNDCLLSKNITDFTTIQKLFIIHQHEFINKFKHIFVDEFQDTNPIQFEIHTGWLLNPTTRLTVVGDDDQSIYRFRGSDIACFKDLEPYCERRNFNYRLAKLVINYRSTKCIVEFTQAFRESTILAELLMQKHIVSGTNISNERPIRLLEGDWRELSNVVAEEIFNMGSGQIPKLGSNPPPKVAILMFSTSERESEARNWSAPALILRQTLEARGIRVYNPRNKTAAQINSPVAMLLGLLSYMIDPVTEAPVGANNRNILVWASSNDERRYTSALSAPPSYRINDKHKDFQLRFRNPSGSGIRPTQPDRQPLLDYIDTIRSELVSSQRRGGPRLTISGLVYRLLSQPLFRNSGFSVNMFRQALFTQLLEANIAPTRLSTDSLDQPLRVRFENGRFIWEDRYWDFLGYFGALLDNATMDDLEIESFEDNAVMFITFHQAKGLEFDHIYVTGTGRSPDIKPALRTLLFSGRTIPYEVSDGLVTTTDQMTNDLSLADREREVYVAITRPKSSLTLLYDPNFDSDYMVENPAITQLFSDSAISNHPLYPSIAVKEWNYV